MNGYGTMGGVTTQGNNWMNSATDTFMYGGMAGSSATHIVVLDAGSERQFVISGSSYIPPADSYLTLTNDTANTQEILTNQTSNLRWTFNDFTISNTAARGRLKEQTTLQMFAQGQSGFQYAYNTNGTVSAITTPTNQDYSITFTYEGVLVKQIQVKDASSNLLAQINYTYYNDVTSPSTDIGRTNDLVQVQVSKKATTDTGSTLSIVRYTQYRYTGTSNLKAVYEHDAIQRILASTGLTSPTAILSKADTYGATPIKDFASRSFTYYTSTSPSTTSVNTPFAASENLVSEYTNSVGSSGTANGLVATETIGGCGGCGTANSVTKSYFYITLPNSLTDQNQAVWLVVEDTQDSAGNAVYRKVMSFENGARMLRQAFIQNPVTSPVYWCDSWTFATSTGSTALPYRLAEHRHPSAHTGVTTAANLQAFLNPYNGKKDGKG
jgi:hypothetical protein